MQLSDMKSHPVIKWLAYLGFGLIIISFIFFYGWESSSSSSYARANSYGRIESDDPLAFLPWRKWENVTADEVRNARLQVANRKLSTLDPTMQMILLQEGQRMGLRLEQTLSTDPEALQQAVDMRLMLREADRVGLNVPRQDVVAQIRNQPGMTAEIWKMILESEGMSESQYIARLQRNQTAFAVQELRADEARLTLPELWRDYQFENEKLRLEVLLFPAEKYTDLVAATDEELQAYLDENQEQYRVPARRKYGYVVIDRAAIRDAVAADEAAVRAYYDANPESFRVPEAALVEDFFAPVADDQPTTAAEMVIGAARAAAEADAEADWETIRDTVRQNHPEWRLYYREVGPIDAGPETEQVHGSDYVQAALGLAQGALSATVKSPLGLHVIRRTGTRESSIPAYEDIADQVRTTYLNAETDRLFNERRDLLRREMGNHATLKAFAEAEGFEYGETELIDAAETVLPGIADLTPHRAYLRTLTAGIISEPIPLGDKMMGLQIVEDQPSFVPPLEELRGEIQAKVEVRKALARAEERAKAALDAVAGGASMPSLARDEGTTTTLTAPLTRRAIERGSSESNLDAVLVDFREASGRAKAGSAGVSVYAPLPGAEAEGYAVWKVRDIESPIREDFDERRRTFALGRLPRAQNVLIEEWLADRRAEIEYEIYGMQFSQ